MSLLANIEHKEHTEALIPPSSRPVSISKPDDSNFQDFLFKLQKLENSTALITPYKLEKLLRNKPRSDAALLIKHVRRWYAELSKDSKPVDFYSLFKACDVVFSNKALLNIQRIKGYFEYRCGVRKADVQALLIKQFMMHLHKAAKIYAFRTTQDRGEAEKSKLEAALRITTSEKKKRGLFSLVTAMGVGSAPFGYANSFFGGWFSTTLGYVVTGILSGAVAIPSSIYAYSSFAKDDVLQGQKFELYNAKKDALVKNIEDKKLACENYLKKLLNKDNSTALKACETKYCSGDLRKKAVYKAMVELVENPAKNANDIKPIEQMYNELYGTQQHATNELQQEHTSYWLKCYQFMYKYGTPLLTCIASVGAFLAILGLVEMNSDVKDKLNKRIANILIKSGIGVIGLVVTYVYHHAMANVKNRDKSLKDFKENALNFFDEIVEILTSLETDLAALDAMVQEQKNTVNVSMPVTVPVTPMVKAVARAVTRAAAAAIDKAAAGEKLPALTEAVAAVVAEEVPKAVNSAVANAIPRAVDNAVTAVNDAVTDVNISIGVPSSSAASPVTPASGERNEDFKTPSPRPSVPTNVGSSHSPSSQRGYLQPLLSPQQQNSSTSTVVDIPSSPPPPPQQLALTNEQVARPPSRFVIR
jgi:hypothetical protein